MPPPQQRGGQADLLRAVEILRAEAECLRECHAPRGDWTAEPEAQADHDEWMDLADRLEALASAPPAPSVGGWMPIESAPKDGTRVILAWGGKSINGFYLDNSNTDRPWAGWRVESMVPAPAGQPSAWQPFPQPQEEKL